MKTFKKMAAQGDLLIHKIAELPEGLELMSPEKNRFVVGHSETGHHHVIPMQGAQVYRNPQNLFVLFVVVDEATTLEHMRSFDKHETLEIKSGIYQINQQREYTPEGFRRAAD
jgi:hypothetical protein